MRIRSGAYPLSQVFYIPWVDLFASRLNRQVDLFVSWKPEPEAWAVDAFSISWQDKNVMLSLRLVS